MTKDKTEIEARLVALIRKGDRKAPEEVYRAYAGYLTGVCTRYLSDSMDVKDTLHDSFLKIIPALPSFEYRGSGSLRAWLTRIVMHESLKSLRRAYRFETLDDTADTIADPIDEPPLLGVTPEALHTMIRSLPVGYRTVLNLYLFEQKSHREIAQLLHIKEASSASQYHRAKAMLARSIRQYQSQNSR